MIGIQMVDGKRAHGLVQLIGNLRQKYVDSENLESNLMKNFRNDIIEELINAKKELRHINKRLKVKVELDNNDYIKHYFGK